MRAGGRAALAAAAARLYGGAHRHALQQTQLHPVPGGRGRDRGLARVRQHQDGGARLVTTKYFFSVKYFCSNEMIHILLQVRGRHGPRPGQREHAALPHGHLPGAGAAPGRGEGGVRAQPQDQGGGYPAVKISVFICLIVIRTPNI